MSQRHSTVQRWNAQHKLIHSKLSSHVTMATPYNFFFFSRILWISMWKTPTYGHLLVDILQGIATRNALLQVAGESVNPLIWTCLKIRHAGPQGSKSPKSRRSGSSMLAGSVKVDVDVFGRIRRQAHTDRTHRASQSSAVLCPLAHLWILVYPKKWVQPRPPRALKYEPYQPPSPPHWGGGGGAPPLLCLKNNSIQTHPPPPLIALSWQVVGFLSVLLYESASEWPLLRKETWRTKILSLFQKCWPTRLHMTIKTQDNVMKF